MSILKVLSWAAIRVDYQYSSDLVIRYVPSVYSRLEVRTKSIRQYEQSSAATFT